MTAMTLKALRALAKRLGLKGYSKLRKQELEALIERAQRRSGAPAETAAAAGAPAPAVTAAATGPRGKKSALVRAHTQTRTAPAAGTAKDTPRAGADRHHASAAPPAAQPPAAAAPASFTPLAPLAEDIDSLFDVEGEPRLVLMPQKPGTLHAYWRLSGPVWRPDLELRLLYARGGGFEQLEEIALPGPSGNWYFHVGAKDEPGLYYAQIGYYTTQGEFTSAFVRATARLPAFVLRAQTERAWWMNEARFRELPHRHAGPWLGWPAAPSSPTFWRRPSSAPFHRS